MESHALVPFAEIKQMAIAVASSKLFGMKTPEEALTLMLLAQAEGMHPITAARDYDIIQGRPAKKAEAMHRDFLKAGGSIKWAKMNDAEAEATFSHPVGGTVTISWDMPRAARAGLATKDNWKKNPRQMLRSRVVSEGIKATYPLATGGVYTPEEVADFDPKPPTKDVESEVKGSETAPAFSDDIPDPVRPERKPIKVQIKTASKPVATKTEDNAAEKSNPAFESSLTRAGLFSTLWETQRASAWKPEEVTGYILVRWRALSPNDLTSDEIRMMIEILKNQTPSEADRDLEASKV